MPSEIDFNIGKAVEARVEAFSSRVEVRSVRRKRCCYDTESIVHIVSLSLSLTHSPKGLAASISLPLSVRLRL